MFTVCLVFSEDEISLNRGVSVNVLQKKNDGWWLIQSEKQRGWFPSNYLIEVISDSFASFRLESVRLENFGESFVSAVSSTSQFSADSNQSECQ